MKIYSVSLSLLFVLLLQCNGMAAFPGASSRPTDENKDEIIQLVTEAVGYEGWINNRQFRSDLALYYDGELLAEITDSVESFRKNSTDWHTLTFIKICHIVYSDGNTALVLAILEETGPEGFAVQGAGDFTLHNTPRGWRITEMNILWPDHGDARQDKFYKQQGVVHIGP